MIHTLLDVSAAVVSRRLESFLLINRVFLVSLISSPSNGSSRKRGLVVNVSSFGGTVICPMMATYSASKAFLIYWSKAIAAELKPKGVDVQCLTPSYIVS